MIDNSKPRLNPLDLHALSAVQVRFSTGEIPAHKYPHAVLVIHFSGTYQSGSRGNSDATYMVAIGNACIKAIDPDAVILDLSELDYQWGDRMAAVMDIGGSDRDMPFPLAIVVGPKCREAIGTLCFGVNSKTDVCQHEHIFDDLADAWAYLDEEFAADLTWG